MGGPAGSVWDGNPDADLGSLYSFLDVQHMRGGRASSFLWKSDRISGRYPAAFGNLPVEKEKTAKNYLEKLSESDYTGKKILLVEDNELNREIAGEILQMTGAKVETAENGKIAVEKVEASPEGLYDLVFMDIQMPVMNGYEATAAIRSLPGENGKLPIVAMTANAFAEDVQLAKNTGMNGHIAKPLDMNKLNDVLENWL